MITVALLHCQVQLRLSCNAHNNDWKETLMNSLNLIAAALAALAGTAAASPIDADFGAPTLDRWMYPFNMSPGSELTAHTFGALGIEGFDDRDSQFIVGFDTADSV